MAIAGWEKSNRFGERIYRVKAGGGGPTGKNPWIGQELEYWHLESTTADNRSFPVKLGLPWANYTILPADYRTQP
ncbi:MAG: hypothetical protein CMJ20_04360 [Phycisphaeraceae bacterium]|nr:hypothetical protein [Phycisphaeraceae bacterium]